MEKEFWKSKTFWSAMLGILGVIGAYLGDTMTLPQAITAGAGFLGMFSLRAAWK